MSNPDLKKLLPHYQCHKVVQAAKIVDVVLCYCAKRRAMICERLQVSYGTHSKWVEIAEEDRVHFGKMATATGRQDAYFILYDNGHMSWSPTKAFEEGYSLRP